MARGQSLYDWCMEHEEYGRQLLFEFGDGNNSQQFVDKETGEIKTPHDFTQGCGKEIPWKCMNNHIMYKKIVRRTGTITYCTKCNGIKLVRTIANKKGSLLSYIEDNSDYIGLTKQWQGEDHNKRSVEMKSIAYTSRTEVLWKCKWGHYWYESVNSRISNYKNCKCPKCYEYNNSILNWCTENNCIDIIDKIWTGKDEFNNKVFMCKESFKSSKNIVWHCNNGHDYTEKIIYVIQHLKTNPCKICRDTKLVGGINDLYTWCTENGERGQQIIMEYTGMCDDGIKIDISKITKGSGKRMLWRCKNEHTWYAIVNSRVHGGTECPYCCGRKISENNSLYSWCKNNKGFGGKLLSEWTGILSETGKTIDIKETACYTDKKLIWRCKNNHYFTQRVGDRTYYKIGCPYCSTSGTSYPEQFLYRALLQIYPNTISRGKFEGVEYDISIPEEKTCIEYSGINWHIDKLDRDVMKDNLCAEHNVRFIQIYAHSGQIDSEDIFDDNMIIYKIDTNKDRHNQQLIEVLDHILKQFGHSISEIDIEKAQTEAFNFMHNIESKQDIIEENTESTIGYQIKPEDF